MLFLTVFSCFLCRCSTDKQTIGALSIFFAWMSLVLFIRKFPKLGIYVVMFTSIFYTFSKFFMIFVLFLVAFALAFYTLLNKQQVREICSIPMVVPMPRRPVLCNLLDAAIHGYHSVQLLCCKNPS